MEKFDWQQTAAQAAKGDRGAFEKLYEQTERSVYFTCLKLLGNEHDARDVMQDTYMKAFEKLSELSDYTKFPQWLKRIAVNNCKTLFRKQKPDYLEDEPEQAAELADENEIIPSDYVSDSAKRHIIMNIIDTELSDIQRQTIILYYYDEMSVAEIAEIMGCPEGTVKYRLSAARDKIREAVLIYENENDDKLHALIPIPVLTSILRKEAEEISIPRIQLFGSEVSSPKRGKGNNSNLNMKGQNAMTNAIKGKIIAGAAAAVIVGGGVTAAVVLSRNNDSDIIKNDSYISEQEHESDNTFSVAPDSDDSETDSIVDDSSAADLDDTDSSNSGYSSGTGVNPLDHDGKWVRERELLFYLPPNMKPGMGAAHSMYYNAIDKKNMWFDFNLLKFVSAYTYDPMDVEELPEYFKDKFVETIATPRRSGRTWYDIEIASEEKIEVFNGEYTFLKQVGTYYEKDSLGERTGEIMYFVVYYGTVDTAGVEDGTYATLEPYTNVPIYWVAMTQEDDLKDYIEEVADAVAEMSYREEE